MVNGSNESLGELASRLREAIVLKETGYYLAENLLFIPVPQWEGWKQIESANEGTVDHFARWEVFFPPGEKRWWVFLRITWPSIAQIVLGFLYPNEQSLLEKIFLHRHLALVDLPLLAGQLNPLSRGIIIHDIPTDLLRAIGIEPGPITVH
jgi:hypothetical protein